MLSAATGVEHRPGMAEADFAHAAKACVLRFAFASLRPLRCASPRASARSAPSCRRDRRGRPHARTRRPLRVLRAGPLSVRSSGGLEGLYRRRRRAPTHRRSGGESLSSLRQRLAGGGWGEGGAVHASRAMARVGRTLQPEGGVAAGECGSDGRWLLGQRTGELVCGLHSTRKADCKGKPAS